MSNSPKSRRFGGSKMGKTAGWHWTFFLPRYINNFLTQLLKLVSIQDNCPTCVAVKTLQLSSEGSEASYASTQQLYAHLRAHLHWQYMGLVAIFAMDGQFLCWSQKNSQEKMIQNSLSSRLCSQQIILGRLYPLILSVNYFLAQSFKILLLFKLVMKDLSTDLLDLSTQPMVFQNLPSSNKSHRRSSRL